MIIWRLNVNGRVQGVGFRRFVQRKAETFKVKGWVRNNADKTVSVEVIGEESAVSAFVQEVERGSLWARVDGLETEFKQHHESEVPNRFVIL